MSFEPKLIVWGAGGHARVVADILQLRNEPAVAFVDSAHPERAGSRFCGAPIFASLDDALAVAPEVRPRLIIAIGDNAERLRIASALAASGTQFAIALHPSAVVAADVTLGPGCVVAAGAVINPGTRVGAHAIINTGATVDHDCVLADGVHVSPGAHLGGGVCVGQGAWIGIGAAIRDHVNIGAGSVVGAGAAVVRNVPAYTVVVGVPARPLRATTSGPRPPLTTP